VLDFCKRLDVQLSMSLPGLSTYREHTRGGDPDHVLRMFREAEAMGVATVAAVTVTRKNLGELHATISAAFLAGAGRLLLNRFLPGGRGLQYADALALDGDQVRQMLDTAEEVLSDANRYGSVGTELPKCVVDPARYQRLEVGTRCSAAIGFFVIDPSGYVRACNHSPQRLNHVGEIDKVKTHPYWRRFTQKDYLPAACGGCESLGQCDGGCREAAHIVSGSVDAPDPLLSSAEQQA
jgi:radical SAM protein with 4Fe4S-binding SPASM domain